MTSNLTWRSIGAATGARQEGNATTTTNSARGQLTLNGVALARRNGLAIKGTISIDTWREIGERIFRISDSSTWWLGDWLVYGQSKYPERYKRAIEETDLDYQTLRNYAWVARHFEASRRRANLSFQHHAEVAKLPDDQQDLWLDRAERHGWSRNELRAQLRAARCRETGGEDVPSAIQIDVSAEQRVRWERAAGNARCDLTRWIQEALDAAARDVLNVGTVPNFLSA